MGKKAKQKKQLQRQNALEIDDIDENDKYDEVFENSKDILVDDLKIVVPGKVLLENTSLKIVNEHKYGLIGANGLGKSTLLKHIYERKFRIPRCIDMFYVDQEVEVSDETSVFDSVINANYKRKKIRDRLDELDIECDKDDVSDDIFDEYGKLEAEWELNEYDKDESIVKKILIGLGFPNEIHNNNTSTFSGGWRMRIALARALYIKPTLLFLDEPTNHLDLNATIWLTDYLTNHWKNTLIIVSHNKNFINEICTDIIHLDNKKLNYYDGNYKKFKQQLKIVKDKIASDWDKMMKEVKKMREKSIPRKQVDEFVKKKALEEPKRDYNVDINFPLTDELTGSLIEVKEVSFGYSDDKLIYNNISFGIDMHTRATIVGVNGVGKSTLLKILSSEIKIPSEEYEHVQWNRKLRIGYYGQHTGDLLPLEMNAVEYLKSIAETDDINDQYCRMLLGKIGLHGIHHLQKISTLSGGQKARVVLASFSIIQPHVLLLDEPTNHLDIESIEGLIDGLKRYNGGIVMVTHDIDLINEIESELWEVDKHSITKTDFDTYSQKIIDNIL